MESGASVVLCMSLFVLHIGRDRHGSWSTARRRTFQDHRRITSAPSTSELSTTIRGSYLLLDGVVRFQHQAADVQIADILTKDLGSKAHRRHRDVIFGRKEIEIKSLKLPESYKTYLTRHNDELKKNAHTLRLAQARKKETELVD